MKKISPEVATILAKARDLLADKKKWTQGTVGEKPVDGFGPREVIIIAAPTYSLRMASLEALRGILATEEKYNISTEAALIRWNDAPGRTHQDVLNAFGSLLENKNE